MGMISTGLWRLSPDDAAPLMALLDRDALLNVYLRSEVRLGGLATGQWWGVGDGDGRLRAVLLGGPLVVPWVPEAAALDSLVEALTRQPPPRMIVGPRDHVLALHRARPGPPPLREVRDPQPYLVLRGAPGVRAPHQLRRAVPADIDRLTLAAADMHREEMGVDPMAVDPTGWRTRMSGLIQRGWSWVWTEDSRVVFKAELSGWTPEAVQIQGVYTAPWARGRGVATAAMAALCRSLLDEVPACTLYVNHYNQAARRLYQRLGFEHQGDNATLMY